LTNNNQKFHHSSESKLTVAAVSDSTVKQIFSLLEEMKEEHDMKKRIKNLESEKSHLLHRLEITLERTDGPEKQLLDAQNLVMRCINAHGKI